MNQYKIIFYHIHTAPSSPKLSRATRQLINILILFFCKYIHIIHINIQTKSNIKCSCTQMFVQGSNPRPLAWQPATQTAPPYGRQINILFIYSLITLFTFKVKIRYKIKRAISSCSTTH